MQFVPIGILEHTQSQRNDLWNINHFLNEPLDPIETHYDYENLTENVDLLYRFSSQLICRSEEIKLLKEKLTNITKVLEEFQSRHEMSLSLMERVGRYFVQTATLGLVSPYSLQSVDLKIRHVERMIGIVETSLNEIDERRNSEDKSESRISELSSHWLENIDEELERLKQGVLTPEVLKELESSDWFGVKVEVSNSATLIQLGHAMEIRKHFRHTHRTFTHGQAIEWIVLNIFNKELARFHEPEKDISSFEFLRHPKLAGEPISVNWAKI